MFSKIKTMKKIIIGLTILGTIVSCKKNVENQVAEKIIISKDTIHISLKLKEDKRLLETSKQKQQPGLNQVTEIYVTDYIMPRVDLAANSTTSFTLDFDHHDPNGQYAILAVSLASLSGNGSAEIMNSLTPILNGYTTLYVHNPHPFVRGETMNMRFIVFFRKNF